MENKSKKRKVLKPITTEKAQAFIMCGSYEKVLLGWNLNSNEDTLQQTFLTVAHQGCIKAMDASRHLLATSSTDETVKLYNLSKKKELGTIQSDSGVVSCLQFYSTTHLFAGSENGNIYVWDTKTWDLLSSLKGHKGAVLGISVHPSGKMMLSISKDGTLKLWDIIKGECAYTSRTEKDAEKVLWSKEGTEYIIVSSNKVDVFNAKDSSKLTTLQLSKKLLAAALINETYMAVGGEDQEITIFNYKTGAIKSSYKAHTNRIKSIGLINLEEPLLVSISSDGYVKLWILGDLSFKESPTLLTEVSTSARLTCVSTSLVIPSNPKDKDSDEEEEEEEEKIVANDDEEEEPQVEVEKPKQQKPKKKKKKVAFRGKS